MMKNKIRKNEAVAVVFSTFVMRAALQKPPLSESFNYLLELVKGSIFT